MGARVHHVKAGKDYPDQGIKKGEMHYTWALFRQRARRSKVKPTRSQLESSEFKSAYYALVDSNLPAATCDGDLETLAGRSGRLLMRSGARSRTCRRTSSRASRVSD